MSGGMSVVAGRGRLKADLRGARRDILARIAELAGHAAKLPVRSAERAELVEVLEILRGVERRMLKLLEAGDA